MPPASAQVTCRRTRSSDAERASYIFSGEGGALFSRHLLSSALRGNTSRSEAANLKKTSQRGDATANRSGERADKGGVQVRSADTRVRAHKEAVYVARGPA